MRSAHPQGSEKQLSAACSVFERIEQQAAEEPDKASKTALRKMGRRLRSVHEELAQYSGLIDLFLRAAEWEWESLVASSRPALIPAFFSHLEMIIRTTPDAGRRQGACSHGVFSFQHLQPCR